MDTKITAIIMANIKTTIRTNSVRLGMVLLSGILTLFAALNLGSTLTPIAKSNQLLDTQFKKIQTLPAVLQIALFKKLREEQELNLSKNASDPYGWARLSYLRLATNESQYDAFSALLMSDFISPYEPLQLPERAIMWHRFHNVESVEQQFYQDTLWEKAYRMDSDSTWDIAVQNNLTKDVEKSFKKTNPRFYGEWKDRELKLN